MSNAERLIGAIQPIFGSGEEVVFDPAGVERVIG